MTAVCTKCGDEKTLDNFHNHPHKANGKQSQCKECVKKPRKERRVAAKKVLSARKMARGRNWDSPQFIRPVNGTAIPCGNKKLFGEHWLIFSHRTNTGNEWYNCDLCEESFLHKPGGKRVSEDFLAFEIGIERLQDIM